MGDTKILLGNDGGIPIPGVGLLKTTEDDALFLDNIREIANLSMMKKNITPSFIVVKDGSW